MVRQVALNCEIGNAEAGSGLLDGLRREVPFEEFFEGVEWAEELRREGSLHLLPRGLRVRCGQPALSRRREEVADDEASRLKPYARPVPLAEQEA